MSTTASVRKTFQSLNRFSFGEEFSKSFGCPSSARVNPKPGESLYDFLAYLWNVAYSLLVNGYAAQTCPHARSNRSDDSCAPEGITARLVVRRFCHSCDEENSPTIKNNRGRHSG